MDSKKEFNECKDLFETIKEYAIEVGDERLANAQTIYKLYFLLFCNLSLYFRLIKGGEYKSRGLYCKTAWMILNLLEDMGKSMQSLACPHIKGNLYYGDIAVEMIDEIREVQAVSLVSHPKDKRCIIELQEDDSSESDKFAKLEQYIALGQPFLQRFSIKSVIETCQREDIIKVERNQLCSCSSGIKFKKCCGKNLYYKHERNIITPEKIVRFE